MSRIISKSIRSCKQSLIKSSFPSIFETHTLRKHNFCDNNNNNSKNESFVSDNWTESNQKIQSVEELSDFGKTLLCGSQFSGDDLDQKPSEIYGEWADAYEHDMDTLQFDSLATMPHKVEQYLSETLNNNIINDEQSSTEQEEANILDVGCGTGLLGELLMENTNVISSNDADNNITIDGMDLTQEMLDILEKERGDLYNEVHQHDMTQTPWPFENDKYDLSVCNGVLIYVKDNGECLDEFIRVTKSGGYCLLMLRGDALSEFSSKIYQLITDKKWQVAEITDTRYNFKAKITESMRKYYVPYNHHIFQVL